MARHAEVHRARTATRRRVRKWKLAAGVCVALLATHGVQAQTGNQAQQSTADIGYKLDYLTQMARLAQDPALQQFLKQQIEQLLQELQTMKWQAYRRCEAMKNPTKGNSGDIYKFAEMEKHRREAIQNLSGISKVLGGAPGSAREVLSPQSGEVTGALKGKALEVAEKLAAGTDYAGVFRNLGPALAALDGGAQLYKTWQAVKVGLEAINQREAADAALTECKKPKTPERLSHGTPELRPFPPLPPPPAPDDPPQSRAPDPTPAPAPPEPPEPDKPMPLGEFLRQAFGANGHAG